MSTPTIATAAVPSHFQKHHYFPNHRTQPFDLGSGGTTYRPVNHVLPSPSRFAPTFPPAATSYTTPAHDNQRLNGAAEYGSSVSRSSRPDLTEYTLASEQPHNTTMAVSARAPVLPPITLSPDDSSGSLKRKRSSNNVDWDKFYEHGLPKEVIVIDDTPEPTPSIAQTSSTLTNGHAHINNYAYASNSAVPASHHGYSTRLEDGPQIDVHQSKKLKRENSGRYDAYPRSAAVHTPRTNGTGSGSTASSDGTNSGAGTTAATSLSSNGHYDQEAQVGQKRKRTRQQIATEARIKHPDPGVNGIFAPYVPPPRPPRKAKDVHVKVIKEVAHVSIPVEERSSRSTAVTKHDDEDGHYIIVPDADLTERYQMNKLLGQGTFGKVVQARDRKRNELVAIKIIRSVQKYRDASKIELRVLATLKANDEANRNRCIHLRDCFDYRGHICIVMDLLGQSVFDFLRANNFVPFPNSQIQSFARQLFTSVAFLHDLNLIHTDLKPENILLYDNAYQTFTYNRKIPSSSATVARQANQRRVLLDTEIRLIDFGSATFQDEYHSSIVSTRHYRAPEIILGLGWSFPCDIWSIGCILIEFFTGDALFQTHDNLEHLAMMEGVVGSRIDTTLVSKVNKNNRGGSNTPSSYFKRLKLDYPQADTTRASRRFVKAMKRLEEIIPNNNPFFQDFRDLLKQIFVYDPAKRITAKQALEHPWFEKSAAPDDGTEAIRIRAERLQQGMAKHQRR